MAGSWPVREEIQRGLVACIILAGLAVGSWLIGPWTLLIAGAGIVGCIIYTLVGLFNYAFKGGQVAVGLG